MTMESQEQSKFDKSEITIRPVVNGWLLKEGPKWYAFIDQESLMKRLIEATTNQRKVYGLFLESLRPAKKNEKED